MHLEAVGSEAYLIQKPLGILYPAFRSYITLQVMAITQQSTSYHDAISTFFKSLQDVQDVQLARTGKPDHFEIGGVLES